MTTRSGRLRLDELAHEREHARDQFGLGVPAIGKERVIGDIDEARIRPCLRGPRGGREAAEPGIEHQDGRRHAPSAGKASAG